MTLRISKQQITAWCALLIASSAIAATNSFSTDGNGIRNIVVGNIKGTRVLYISEIDGAVSCYQTDGKKRWRNPSQSPAVMFEIEAFDVDHDGRDELLAASGDGHIYCWDSNGTLRWKFNPGHKVRFSEVAALETGNTVRVFAGGNDYILYELDAKGALVSKTKIDGVVRKIETGNFLKKGTPSIFLMTYSHDKFRWAFMGLLDPETKEVQTSFDYKNADKNIWTSLMVNDLSIVDLDKDGRDDLLFFGHNTPAVFVGLNGQFDQIAHFAGSRKQTQRYAHGIGTCLLPFRDEIVMQYGGILYVCDLNGNLLHTSGERYRSIIFNDLVVEPGSGTLLAGGQIGGGNGVYSFPLKSDDWWMTKHTLTGRMAEVAANLNTLYQQTLNFKPPTYQPPAKKDWIMLTSVQELPALKPLHAARVRYVHSVSMQEKSDRKELVAAIGEVALRKDRRMAYNKTQQEIIALAREQEKKGEPFVTWAGHGNDPFITPIDTMEKVLEAAPNTCYGFIYAEMSNVHDPRVQYFIKEYIPRLVRACRKQGKAKLYFRYKNVFWAASSHLDPWKDMFFSGKYSDVLIPSAEDTNSRTQDINFAGRVGMLAGGYVNDFAMRLVDDNPTSWRPLSPGGQRSVSPYLRNGALLAAYGARYGLLFNIGYLEKPGMNMLFALMKSGVLPIVEKDDLLSISSWHLIRNPDQKLIESIDDGHNMMNYSVENENAVLSAAQVSWCGSSVADYDFSKQALGVHYRWLNFMPELPHGMVPVAPIDYAPKLVRQGIPFTVSDWKKGFVDGTPVPAKEFGRNIGAAARNGADKMPVVVTGAAWSAIRLDAKHIRVVLIDPGYIDPQDRMVTIQFNGKQPSQIKDILNGQQFPTTTPVLQLTVPAGSMRFIDLSYSTE